MATLKPSLWSVLALAISAFAAHADQPSAAPGTQLPEVVITAPPDILDTPTLPLMLPAQLDKTGTPIEDVPRSIEIIPRALFEQQGATLLRQTLPNLSGVSQGGQFAFGFFDRFIVRGLDANFLDDGLPDETSDLTGIPHSLTGVERVEVLKGPGSALYGSSEPGGTINLVHYRPADTYSANISEQVGSYGTTTTDISGTGPTTIPDLDWRIDGEFQKSDGFRGQQDEVGEVLPALRWRPANHDVNLRLEYHHLDFLPDAAGIPFSPPKGTGQPLDVSVDDRYYTPFARGDQNIARVTLSDAWTVSDLLTVNNALSFTNRGADILRNAGGSVTALGATYELTNRQLRSQQDNINDFVYQLEPIWHFQTGTLAHTLLTGFSLHDVDAISVRSTADLPNILNIFDPVVLEQNLSSLVFKCDAAHSCYNDRLWARYYGVYAIDQIDVTDALKLRLSARQNWFTTAGEARTASAVNPGNVYPCPSIPTGCPFVPGQPVSRTDTPFTWEVGAVYFFMPHASVFTGYSDSAYPIFNTEEPQSIAQAPERSRQYELGVRYEIAGRIGISSALFQATRENVFDLETVPNPNGPGNMDIASFFAYRVRGWENDLNVHLGNWNLIANLTLQRPVITSYPTASDVGNMAPSVPPVLANFWTTYDVPLPEPAPDVRLAVGLRYQGQEYADVGQTRIVPGAPVVDMGVQAHKGGYMLQVGLSNAFNQRNFLYGAGTGGGAYPGTGRMAYARLSIALN